MSGAEPRGSGAESRGAPPLRHAVGALLRKDARAAEVDPDELGGLYR